VPNPNPTAALQIVLAEERAKGWTPRDLGAKEQLQYGCDILSAPPDGGDPHRIEVKAMGRPFLTKTGKWSWPDIVVRQSQLDACKGDRAATRSASRSSQISMHTVSRAILTNASR
jgi:hypothetical protein